MTLSEALSSPQLTVEVVMQPRHCLRYLYEPPSDQPI